MSRGRITLHLGMLAAVALTATPATANRTTVDSGGGRLLFGYCDYSGEDCLPQQLGFSVDFGNGPTSSFIIYGNGLISFGDTPVDYKRSKTYNPNTDTLAVFGGTVVSAGLFNTIVSDGNGPNPNKQVFATDAYIVTRSSNALSVNFEYCVTPNICGLQAGIGITTTPNGLHVDVSQDNDFGDGNSPGTLAAGYALNGKATMLPINQFSFDILARIGAPVPPSAAVPEPASWAMLLVGFGAVGATMRRRLSPAPRRDVAASAG